MRQARMSDTMKRVGMTRRLGCTAAVAVGFGLLVGACGGEDGGSARASAEADALFATELASPANFALSSPNFTDGGALPARFSCDGTEISPALRVAGVPEGTAELSVVMDDPDAEGGTFVHWIVTGMAPTSAGLAEDLVPADASQANNSDGRPRYQGACPPKESAAHTYRITVYALNEATGSSLEGKAAAEALGTIAERATAKSSLSVTYQRQS